MYKLLLIICVIAIVALTACNRSEFDTSDMFSSPDIVNVSTTPKPAEDTKEPIQDNNETGIEPLDVPLDGQPIPNEDPVAAGPDYEAEVLMIKELVAPLYGDEFVYHQTPSGNFDILEFEDGSISIMTSRSGRVMRVFYEFDYDIDEGIEALHDRVSVFASVILETEITEEDNVSITNALDMIFPGMPDPVFIEIGEHFIELSYISDGSVTLVW
jgi:hypothetical protein